MSAAESFHDLPPLGAAIGALIAVPDADERAWLHSCIQADGRFAVEAACPDREGAAESLRAHQPELALLDAELGSGGAGFDLARCFDPERTAIVFLAGDAALAANAFEYHPVDFLVRPLAHDRLYRALTHAAQRVQLSRRARMTGVVLDALNGRPASTAREDEHWITRIPVPHNGRIALVPVAEIDWVEAAGNYVILHAGDKRHTIRMPIGKLAGKLDPDGFARIHRSTIVNLDRVAEFRRHMNGDYLAILTNGVKLRLSRRYRARVLDPV